MSKIVNLATEDEEQAALFMWAAYAQGAHPELGLMYSVPNGGLRNIATAVRLKKTGTRAGVPDIFLPVAKGGFHGLFVEMKKREGGRVNIEQKIWLNALNEQGYRAVVCKGWEHARDEITKYLEVMP